MRTVLVADDNEGNREIMRVALETIGYRVVEAGDGREAIDMALGAVEDEMPDLFLLDIQMPHVDGYEVIETLRRETRYALTPAIAVTAYAMPGDQDKALAAGFTKHVAKPINIAMLRHTVRELLGT